MLEKHFAGEQETIGGQYRDALSSAFHGNRFADSQKAPPPARLTDSGGTDQVDERLSAAVQDWHFEVIDFYESVVDAHAIERAQQMFRGGNQNALPHQAGGIADLLHIT